MFLENENKKPNSFCDICGKPYYVCNSCKEFSSWRLIADVPECYKIHIIIKDYALGYISKEKAKSMIMSLDIKDFSVYLDYVQEIIETIAK